MKRILPFVVVSVLLHTLIIAGFKKIRQRNEILHELTTTEIHTPGVAKAPVGLMHSRSPITAENLHSAGTQMDASTVQETGDSHSLESAYESHLSQEIARLKKYPPQSKSLGQQGEVIVGFRVMSDGLITDLVVQKSSEYSILDQAAMQIFKEMGHAPTPPQNWPEQGKVFIQKIQYYLD